MVNLVDLVDLVDLITLVDVVDVVNMVRLVDVVNRAHVWILGHETGWPLGCDVGAGGPSPAPSAQWGLVVRG